MKPFVPMEKFVWWEVRKETKQSNL